jgi:hypothetical protein
VIPRPHFTVIGAALIKINAWAVHACFFQDQLKTKEENMLDKTQTGAKGSSPETQSPFNIVGAQERGVALFTQLNELMVKTARAVWESQTELLRLETEQATKSLFPVKIGEDPGETISAYCDQLHDRTDRMITQARRINDLYKDYGWQLFAIYSEALHQASKPSQGFPRA